MVDAAMATDRAVVIDGAMTTDGWSQGCSRGNRCSHGDGRSRAIYGAMAMDVAMVDSNG